MKILDQLDEATQERLKSAVNFTEEELAEIKRLTGRVSDKLAQYDVDKMIWQFSTVEGIEHQLSLFDHIVSTVFCMRLRKTEDGTFIEIDKHAVELPAEVFQRLKA